MRTPTLQRFRGPGRASRAFTLIEILIVAAIISLFAGLAVFSVTTMYDSNKVKAMRDEAKTLGTAVGMAQQDLGFYPRLNMLPLPLNMIAFSQGGTQQIRPAFDAYGYLGTTDRVSTVVNNWQGPYTNFSPARRANNMLVKMRLPEPANIAFPDQPAFGGSVSLVDWPSDIWGNPYVVYLVKTDPASINGSTNPMGLRLISHPGESPDYFAAVVSYGPNGIPGGTDPRANPQVAGSAAYNGFVQNVLTPASLFVKGDSNNGGALFTADNIPVFTLKSAAAGVIGDYSLTNTTFVNALPRSITSGGVTDEIGIKDPGSDDIFWVF